MMKQLSVVLATYNESKNIKRCLEAIRDIADEVIVVDGSSTDDTRNIARNLGAKVTKTTNKPIFHINKQLAMDQAKGDWILQLDADEVVDDEMKKAIKHVLKNGTQHNAFWLKRKNYFLNTFLTKGGQYPDPVIRLYKRGKAHLPQKSVHEQMEVVGTTGWLKGHLNHYNAPTFARYITNANRYTSLTADTMYKQKIQMTFKNDVYYLIIKPIMTFLSLFLRHKGFMDGFPGFAFALFSGLHHAVAYMKLNDIYRAINNVEM